MTPADLAGDGHPASPSSSVVSQLRTTGNLVTAAGGIADKRAGRRNPQSIPHREVGMTEAIYRTQHLLRIGCLVVLCLITASVPASLAKKGNFRTQEGSAFIPSGTTLAVRMIDELDTGKTQPGDSFSASLDRPVVIDGRTMAAKDALVRGMVTEVVSSGRMKRPASLTLKLTQITLSSGQKVPIETEHYTLDGKSHNVRNAAL